MSATTWLSETATELNPPWRRPLALLLWQQHRHPHVSALDGIQTQPRQLQETCETLTEFETPFQNNDAVPPYTGIMFEIFSKTNIEILSLELDLRVANAIDLSVEVYSLIGSFTQFVNDESAWEHVATSTLVWSLDGTRAILPVQDFTPVVMPQRQKRSFYITLKVPAIEHTVYALQKTGEQSASGPDFDTMVGSGLTEYKFPEKVDRILDPQFAGIIHYRKSGDCNTLVTQTMIDFKFLLEMNYSSDLPPKLNALFEEFMAQLLQASDVLKNYVNQYGLQITAGIETTAVSFSSDCPSSWTICPNTYMSSKVALVHLQDLPSGLVQYEIYKATTAMARAVATEFPDIQSIYIGQQSVSVAFSLALIGVPANVEMDAIQSEFFADVTRDFLHDAATARFSDVFDVDVEAQNVDSSGKKRHMRSLRHRRNTQGELSTNNIVGSIAGSIPVAFDAQHFLQTIDGAFSSMTDDLIALWKARGILPGDINEDDRFAYFDSVAGLTVQLRVIERDVGPTVISDSSSELSSTAIAAIEGAAFLVVLVGCTMGYKTYKKKQKEKEDAKVYREERRKEQHALMIADKIEAEKSKIIPPQIDGDDTDSSSTNNASDRDETETCEDSATNKRSDTIPRPANGAVKAIRRSSGSVHQARISSNCDKKESRHLSKSPQSEASGLKKGTVAKNSTAIAVKHKKVTSPRQRERTGDTSPSGPTTEKKKLTNKDGEKKAKSYGSKPGRKGVATKPGNRSLKDNVTANKQNGKKIHASELKGRPVLSKSLSVPALQANRKMPATAKSNKIVEKKKPDSSIDEEKDTVSTAKKKSTSATPVRSKKVLLKHPPQRPALARSASVSAIQKKPLKLLPKSGQSVETKNALPKKAPSSSKTQSTLNSKTGSPAKKMNVPPLKGKLVRSASVSVPPKTAVAPTVSERVSPKNSISSRSPKTAAVAKISTTKSGTGTTLSLSGDCGKKKAAARPQPSSKKKVGQRPVLARSMSVSAVPQAKVQIKAPALRGKEPFADPSIPKRRGSVSQGVAPATQSKPKDVSPSLGNSNDKRVVSKQIENKRVPLKPVLARSMSISAIPQTKMLAKGSTTNPLTVTSATKPTAQPLLQSIATTASAVTNNCNTQRITPKPKGNGSVGSGVRQSPPSKQKVQQRPVLARSMSVSAIPKLKEAAKVPVKVAAPRGRGPISTPSTPKKGAPGVACATQPTALSSANTRPSVSSDPNTQRIVPKPNDKVSSVGRQPPSSKQKVLQRPVIARSMSVSAIPKTKIPAKASALRGKGPTTNPSTPKKVATPTARETSAAQPTPTAGRHPPSSKQKVPQRPVMATSLSVSAIPNTKVAKGPARGKGPTTNPSTPKNDAAPTSRVTSTTNTGPSVISDSNNQRLTPKLKGSTNVGSTIRQSPSSKKKDSQRPVPMRSMSVSAIAQTKIPAKKK